MFTPGRISLRELFILAYGIYKHCFRYIVAIGLVVYVPVNIVLVILATRLDIAAIMAGDLSLLYRYSVVALIIESAVIPLEVAAITYFTKQRLNGASVTVEGTLDATFGNWGRLASTALLYMLLVTVSSILIIPGIFFAVLFCFHSSIIVTVENSSGFNALRRSAALVKGRWWKTLCILILNNLGVIGVQALVGVLLDPVFALLPDTGLAIDALNVAGSATADVLGIAFGIITALYFFNLYYSFARPTEEPAQ